MWRVLEKRKSSPTDLYVELLRFTRRKLGLGLSAVDPAFSDPQLARDEFFALPQPPRESICIEVLEGYYDVLKDFKGTIAEEYKGELQKFVEDHNLRYNVDVRCKFEISIPGLLASQFVRLSDSLQQNRGLGYSLKLLQSSVGRLKDGADEERRCIELARILLEGIARAKTTNGGRTLGKAIEGCNVFPHEELMLCVKNFDEFTNDYPALRHHGAIANQKRELRKDDAIWAVAFALSFGGLVYDNNCGQHVLDGEL